MSQPGFLGTKYSTARNKEQSVLRLTARSKQGPDTSKNSSIEAEKVTGEDREKKAKKGRKKAKKGEKKAKKAEKRRSC